jgi:hypothetical protein
VTRWVRSVGAGTLLEVSFEDARPDPVQGLVLEVDRGHLAWDEQGEEASAIRLWADRHDSVVLRITARGPRKVTLSAWHAWMDPDLGGDVVRRGERIRVEDGPDGVRLHCGSDDLVARVAVRQRDRASSA